MLGERLGIAVGILGLGATLLTAALALGGVKVSAVLLWVMGAVGVLLMLAGVLMPLMRRNVAPVSTDRGRVAGTPRRAPRKGYVGSEASTGNLSVDVSEPSLALRELDQLRLDGLQIADAHIGGYPESENEWFGRYYPWLRRATEWVAVHVSQADAVEFEGGTVSDMRDRHHSGRPIVRKELARLTRQLDELNHLWDRLQHEDQ